jgi:uncharacterized protein (TIGR00255 family)
MTLRSMTGYGRARRARGPLSAEAEARSVNGRYLQVRCRLPSELVRLEARLETLVKQRLSRGTVDVSVRLSSARRSGRPRVNRQVLAVYRQALDALGGGDSAALLGLPGVVSFGEEAPAEGAVDALVLGAAGEALARMEQTRAAEGGRLRTVLRRELAALRRHVAAIARLSPSAVKAHHEAMHERLGKLLARRAEANGGAPLANGTLANDPALLRELALLADKHDVTEELDRLDSHLVALAGLLDSKQPAGRQLDFLLQEVGREVNTIGSKAADARIAARIIQAKSVVEKLREQAANIE